MPVAPRNRSTQRRLFRSLSGHQQAATAPSVFARICSRTRIGQRKAADLKVDEDAQKSTVMRDQMWSAHECASKTTFNVKVTAMLSKVTGFPTTDAVLKLPPPVIALTTASPRCTVVPVLRLFAMAPLCSA